MIGKRLKTARKQKELTQQEVAEIVHVSRATVSSWEVGRTYPSLDVLVELSELYELSLDTLLKEDMKMVEQVSKEVKQKRIYKRIVVGTGIILMLFLLINLWWYVMNYRQYNYVKENWREEGSSYVMQSDGIEYSTPKFDHAALFRNHYLKKETLPVWAVYVEDDSKDGEPSPNISLSAKGKINVLVPIGKVLGLVQVDSKMELMGDGEMPVYLDFIAHPEDLERINEYLDKNKSELELLHEHAAKQYELINR